MTMISIVLSLGIGLVVLWAAGSWLLVQIARRYGTDDVRIGKPIPCGPVSAPRG